MNDFEELQAAAYGCSVSSHPVGASRDLLCRWLRAGQPHFARRATGLAAQPSIRSTLACRVSPAPLVTDTISQRLRQGWPGRLAVQRARPRPAPAPPASAASASRSRRGSRTDHSRGEDAPLSLLAKTCQGMLSRPLSHDRPGTIRWFPEVAGRESPASPCSIRPWSDVSAFVLT